MKNVATSPHQERADTLPPVPLLFTAEKPKEQGGGCQPVLDVDLYCQTTRRRPVTEVNGSVAGGKERHELAGPGTYAPLPESGRFVSRWGSTARRSLDKLKAKVPLLPQCGPSLVAFMRPA